MIPDDVSKKWILGQMISFCDLDSFCIYRDNFYKSKSWAYLDEGPDEEGGAEDERQGHLVYHPLLVADLAVKVLKPRTIIWFVGQR